MPVSVPVSFAAYSRNLESGCLSLDGVRCPACRAEGLTLTSTTLQRSVVLPVSDASGDLELTRTTATIALARCPDCGHRVRVLPADILPRKTFSLSAVERCCAKYLREGSLRRTVETFGAHRPAHTTLHAWTDGLGAHFKGLTLGDVPCSTPISAVIVETESRFRGVGAALEATTPVHAHSYRSEERWERLTGLEALLRGGLALASPDSVAPLTDWRRRSLRIPLLSCPFGFRTGIRSTRIEHPVSVGLAARQGAAGRPPPL